MSRAPTKLWDAGTSRLFVCSSSSYRYSFAVSVFTLGVLDLCLVRRTDATDTSTRGQGRRTAQFLRVWQLGADPNAPQTRVLALPCKWMACACSLHVMWRRRRVSSVASGSRTFTGRVHRARTRCCSQWRVAPRCRECWPVHLLSQGRVSMALEASWPRRRGDNHDV